MKLRLTVAQLGAIAFLFLSLFVFFLVTSQLEDAKDIRSRAQVVTGVNFSLIADTSNLLPDTKAEISVAMDAPDTIPVGAVSLTVKFAPESFEAVSIVPAALPVELSPGQIAPGIASITVGMTPTTSGARGLTGHHTIAVLQLRALPQAPPGPTTITMEAQTASVGGPPGDVTGTITPTTITISGSNQTTPPLSSPTPVPNPTQFACSSDADCPQLGVPCSSTSCLVNKCINGSCRIVDMAVSPTAALPGHGCTIADADGDNDCDMADWEIFRQEFLGEASTKRADFNKDSAITILDFQIWRRAFFEHI